MERSIGRQKIVWVAKCPSCGEEKEREGETAPRERMCKPCGLWVPYEQKSVRQVL